MKEGTSEQYMFFSESKKDNQEYRPQRIPTPAFLCQKDPFDGGGMHPPASDLVCVYIHLFM